MLGRGRVELLVIGQPQRLFCGEPQVSPGDMHGHLRLAGGLDMCSSLVWSTSCFRARYWMRLGQWISKCGFISFQATHLPRVETGQLLGRGTIEFYSQPLWSVGFAPGWVTPWFPALRAPYCPRGA